jgi:hypothetical protein
MACVRFRIRTMMLVTGVIAILMAAVTGLARMAPWSYIFRSIASISYLLFNFMITSPRVALLAVALFVVIVQSAVFWDRYRLLRRKPGRFATRARK